jgi:hypothetical protein
MEAPEQGTQFDMYPGRAAIDITADFAIFS